MEEYKRQIGKLAVAQLCQVIGFSTISSQALDTLEEVMRLLIEKIAERAKMVAEHSNRTECNILDILKGLEVIQCSEDTINAWLAQNHEFSFARAIKFPGSNREITEENPRPVTYENNIPNFLPRFPPAHTYMFTPVPIMRNMDAATLRAIKIKEKREIEERLAAIAAGSSSSVDLPMNVKNPYVNLGLINSTSHLLQE